MFEIFTRLFSKTEAEKVEKEEELAEFNQYIASLETQKQALEQAYLECKEALEHISHTLITDNEALEEHNQLAKEAHKKKDTNVIKEIDQKIETISQTIEKNLHTQKELQDNLIKLEQDQKTFRQHFGESKRQLELVAITKDITKRLGVIEEDYTKSKPVSPLIALESITKRREVALEGLLKEEPSEG